MMLHSGLSVPKLEYNDRKLTGPIPDVDYEVETSKMESVRLQDLCLKKIVSDSFITRRYLHFMPNKIQVLIMNKALEEGRFPTMSFLLKNWPFPVFQFPALPILKNYKLSCSCQNRMIYSNSLRQSLECATAILNVFIEIVNKYHVNSKLKVVDLSPIPLSEKLVLKLCHYIFGMSHSATRNLENSDATEKYILKIHCTLNSWDSVEALHQALAAEKMGLSPIKLCVCGLRCTNTCFPNKNLIHMASIIDPLDLQVFSMDFALILEVRAKDLLQSLGKFHNLKVLDFAYCRLRQEFLDEFLSLLRSLFQELVHISRLDFTNCRVGNHLSYLLEHLHGNKSPSPDTDLPPTVNKKFKYACLYPGCQSSPIGGLEYLNLNGCSVSSNDLEFLATSPHMRTLKNLNLRSNPLGSHFHSFLTLLRALAPSLCVLEINNTYIPGELVSELFAVLLEMKNLRFLSIVNLLVPVETHFVLLPQLCKLPFLRTLGISVPNSLGVFQVLEFRTKVVNLIANERKNLDILWMSHYE